MDSREGRKNLHAYCSDIQSKTSFRIFDFEIDCWFRKFDQCPLSEVLDKMVDMLQKKWVNNEPYVAIDKKRIVDLLEVHIAQSDGGRFIGCSKSNLRSG